VDAAEAGGGVGFFYVPLGVDFFCGEGCGEEEEEFDAAIRSQFPVHRWCSPRPCQKNAKVFEIKELGVDFGFGYGTKVESPACAGLWFLPDLIVAGVSRVGGGARRPRGFLAPLYCVSFLKVKKVLKKCLTKQKAYLSG
jgi:hypothetical protein